MHENILGCRPFRKDIPEVQIDAEAQVGISIYDLSGRILQEVYGLYRQTIPGAKVTDPWDGFDMEMLRVRSEIGAGRDYVKEFGSLLNKKSALVIHGTGQADRNHQVVVIEFDAKYTQLGGPGRENKFNRDIANLFHKEKLAVILK